MPAPVVLPAAVCGPCATEHGILLIADEVQSGYGRTGKMWGFEHAGIVPDVVCLAKAIANGLPLSAIVTRPRAAGSLGRRGSHGSTFGGNPVVARPAVAVMQTIVEQNLVANPAARHRRSSC